MIAVCGIGHGQCKAARILWHIAIARLIEEKKPTTIIVYGGNEEDVTISNDLLLHEDNNEDRIYIVRCWFDEYVIGGESYKHGEEHYMNLSEALNANLKEIGVLDRDITLFQWLRERDYEGVEYDHNFDDL